MRYCDFPRDHVSEEKGTGYCGRHTGTQAGSHALFRNTCCTWSFNAYWIWASVTNRRQRSEKQSTILLTLQKQYFLLFITLVCIFSFWHLHRKKNSCKKKAVVCVFFFKSVYSTNRLSEGQFPWKQSASRTYQLFDLFSPDTFNSRAAWWICCRLSCLTAGTSKV